MEPTDRGLDRRTFVRRMAAVTAAAASGTTLATPGSAAAADTARVRLSPATPLPDPPPQQSGSPAELTVAEASALIRDGRLSPVELVEALLDRIERWDGTYVAFNTVLAGEARARAEELERAPYRGPLHGIPLVMKDNFYTAGVRTSANSYIYQDFVPSWSATAWARLEGAGAILLGKTQMGPLATSRATTPDGQNTTVNAWAPDDPTVDPGGSSSGSATAVASRMAPSATGTQTGGSITRPSGSQGLTGLKPTMGRVSLRGIIPLTYTRDHPGPLARDAMDAAIMLQAMAGPDPGDPRTLGAPEVPDYVTAATPVRRGGRPGVRWPTTIGVLPDYLDVEEAEEPDEEDLQDLPPDERREREERFRRRRAHAEAEVAARRRMLSTFESLGARVVEVDYPTEWETLTSREFNNVRLPERSEPFLEQLRDDVRNFGVSLSPWINGLLLPGTEYLRGQRAKLLLLQRVLDEVFGHCDVVVQTAPFPFDIIGLPLVTFPIGFEEESIDSPRPVPALFGGPPWAEDRLLSLAAAHQEVTDFHRRRPAQPADGAAAAHLTLRRARPPWGSPTAGTRDRDPRSGGLGRGRIDAEEMMERSE